jgi:hypothetical protein
MTADEHLPRADARRLELDPRDLVRPLDQDGLHRGDCIALAAALVREALVAQLSERAVRLRETRELHAFEHTVGLRELDVAVVDHLPVVAPGSRKS